MGIIKVMNAELVGRIAAGEVVERPASVVKELMENSIDAGAHQIRVNIEQGGQKLIQVIDDGCGMDRQDAMLCLETHATSKIMTTGDVGQIATLGFRGEAMPSIAAISRFSMQTRRPEDSVGTEVFVDFGAIRDVRDCGCAAGTNIRVSQLFANLPARRKFLRGFETEDGYIEEMVRNVALSRPDVTILLTMNGREALRLPAAKELPQRVSAVIGKEAFAAMVPLHGEEDGIRVCGFVSKPGYTRSNRREQRIVINGRSATAESVYLAIRDAFESLVVKGRYPAAVIYVDLPPDRVDVNVHPTKREVRFREPRIVGQVIATAIRQALRGMPGDAYFEPQTEVFAPPPPTRAPKPIEVPVVPAAPIPAPPPTRPMTAQELALPLEMPPCPTPAETVREQVKEHLEQEKVELSAKPVSGQGKLHGMKFLSRLGKGYALAETDSGLVILNLKAVHQRILFEKLLHYLNETTVPQQPLLLAVTVKLTPDDARFLRQNLRHFQKLGFQIEGFGGNDFIVSAVPASFPDTEIGQVLRDMLDDLRKSTVTNRQSSVHLAQVASRYAITGNREVTEEEIFSLLKRLQMTEMPYTDPWGHPTMTHISYQELERRFQ